MPPANELEDGKVYVKMRRNPNSKGPDEPKGKYRLIFNTISNFLRLCLVDVSNVPASKDMDLLGGDTIGHNERGR